jgi:hypothetical protein
VQWEVEGRVALAWRFSDDEFDNSTVLLRVERAAGGAPVTVRMDLALAAQHTRKGEAAALLRGSATRTLATLLIDRATAAKKPSKRWPEMFSNVAEKYGLTSVSAALQALGEARDELSAGLLEVADHFTALTGGRLSSDGKLCAFAKPALLVLRRVDSTAQVDSTAWPALGTPEQLQQLAREGWEVIAFRPDKVKADVCYVDERVVVFDTKKAVTWWQYRLTPLVAGSPVGVSQAFLAEARGNPAWRRKPRAHVLHAAPDEPVLEPLDSTGTSWLVVTCSNDSDSVDSDLERMSSGSVLMAAFSGGVTCTRETFAEVIADTPDDDVRRVEESFSSRPYALPLPQRHGQLTLLPRAYPRLLAFENEPFAGNSRALLLQYYLGARKGHLIGMSDGGCALFVANSRLYMLDGSDAAEFDAATYALKLADGVAPSAKDSTETLLGPDGTCILTARLALRYAAGPCTLRLPLEPLPGARAAAAE